MKLTDRDLTRIQEELSEEDLAFLNRLAQKIYDSGFITAAVFTLELVKPLALLGSHTMIFFGPIISAFINADGYYRAAQLFEEPRNVERLITRLEELEQNNKKQANGEAQ